MSGIYSAIAEFFYSNQSKPKFCFASGWIIEEKDDFSLYRLIYLYPIFSNFVFTRKMFWRIFFVTVMFS